MDSLGRITSEEETSYSKMGDNVYLTIDIEFQKKVEESLKKIISDIQNGKINGLKYADAKCGSAVVVNVKTGEVLAMASYPDYSPQDFVSRNI
jgi:penicillin-binding protein 2